MRLGLSIVLSMNVMAFTMALWTNDVYGVLVDAGNDGGALAASMYGLFRHLCLLLSLPVLGLQRHCRTGAAYQEPSRRRHPNGLWRSDHDRTVHVRHRDDHRRDSFGQASWSLRLAADPKSVVHLACEGVVNRDLRQFADRGKVSGLSYLATAASLPSKKSIFSPYRLPKVLEPSELKCNLSSVVQRADEMT